MFGAIAKGVIEGSLGNILDKLVPDREGRKKFDREFKELLEEGFQAEEAAQAADRQAQLEINKIEAAHKSMFVAGWRPAIGWICAIGIFWSFLGQPIADTILDIAGSDILLPQIPEDRLWELVSAMLGLSGLRTFEKFKKVARNR
ncbi:hypothetical protein LCGC14_1177870 [marine sediment metagenome]|uniref:Holin of 3TMs, for gene-transfer release n=1 Tax=marine sediment metagenome TaxID=412755 RepID=A0A0F9MAT7_9ZZZZ